MVSTLLFRSLLGATTLLLSSFPLLAAGEPIKATITYHNDGSYTSTVINPDNRTSEETTQTKQGKILRKVTYVLDDRNQPLGSIVYDPKGTVLYRSSYKRDGMGRIDEENVTDSNGQPLRRRVYTYQGANNKVSRVDEYDAAGNLIMPPSKQKPATPSRGRPDKKR